MIGYEDLRLIAAIAAHGGVRPAAVQQQVHVATLYRQLRSLEARLGGALFEKCGAALVPTARAEPLLLAEADVRDRLAEVERCVAAQDDRIVGPLMVTTADTLLPLVCSCLKAFSDAEPGIAMTLVAANAFADLGRREADVAIRPTRTPPETLIGTCAGTFEFAAYALSESDDQPWIGYDRELASVPAAGWLRRHVAPEDVALCVASITAAADAAEAGWGRALLPEYLGRARPLVRVGAPIDSLESQLWVLSHPDLRRNARVRAFTAFAGPWLRRALVEMASG